jgi:nucleotide-binding universal stress UspA family protein
VAARRDARVVVLTAFSPGSPLGTDLDAVGRRIIDARGQGESMVQELARQGIPGEADVAQGPAAEAIIKAAESHDADLIVIGTHRRNPLSDWLSRSTSKQVLRSTTTPVLVVH